jgi:hypothetical protein
MKDTRVISKQARSARRWIRRNLHHIAVAKIGGESKKIKTDRDGARLLKYARKCARVLIKEDVRA